MFQPDYRNLVTAAKNHTPARLPLYDHLVGDGIIEAILGEPVAPLIQAGGPDLIEGLRRYHEFFLQLGYDACPFERCITDVLEGGGALGKHQPGCIKSMADFSAYPWDEIPQRYFAAFAPTFEALQQTLPPGMKAVGGVGNGVFECVQDLVGYMDLCLIRYDDPELYALLFKRMGEVALQIWERFLTQYGDAFCVCRFGDDLGFKTMTLIPEDDIKQHILPVYKQITALVHNAGKPFLLHSCGNIFSIMEDLISDVKIDAKHSNEDLIAPFQTWVDLYGDRIGNFGGLDCDVLCISSLSEVKERTKEIIRQAGPFGGFAFGTGNSVPDFIPVDAYLAMNEAAREARGE
jgi:uroporphyrinogen decarboxylase